MAESQAFLTAEWRYLAMVNFEVPRELLEPHVPRGTALDTWQGRHYVSLVGFLFRNTRVRGVAIPCHRDFEEINLRFYVRRDVDGETRRAVTFLKELVPRRAIALVARRVYNEPYDARPMRNLLEPPAASGDLPARMEYGWREGRGKWGRLAMTPATSPSFPEAGSEAEFITEHYWGYTRQRDGGTVEYHVAHPPWPVATAATVELDGDLEALYGPALAAVLREKPLSAFMATGSAVSVFAPARLDLAENAPDHYGTR